MKTDRQLIERLLELQEHPERLRVGDETSGMQVTDEQLQQALDDPQMSELVEQMAFAKRAFKNEELQDVYPDVEGEWEKFSADHYGEENSAEANYSPFTLHSSLKKIAASLTFSRACSRSEEQMQTSLSSRLVASFIGVLLVSGMAFAAIHIVRMVNSHKADTVQTEQPASYKPSTALPADTVKTDTATTVQPVVFDNVPLENMLTEIATYYHVEVSFLNDDTRQLRFHFVWKREDGLRHAIEKLNRFESLNVRLNEGVGEHQSTKIIVE
jgi:hypothetical protein